MKKKRSSFHPNCDMSDKKNFKTFNLIERDGTIFERILLDVPDVSLREYLVCVHYLKQQIKVFNKEPKMFNIISRDKPWDFYIETDYNENFNVEITSIADDSDSFEKMKREERLIKISNVDQIAFHELIKLNSFFPTENITTLIDDYRKKDISKRDLVLNPFKDFSTNIFLSNSNGVKKNLDDLLIDSIKRKESKNHKDKESTIILIDNRTLSYEISDFYESLDRINDVLKKSSFKEIWIYTGYCSNEDGNNAEYSFIPIKTTEEQEKIITEIKNKGKQDEDGIAYF